LFQCAREAVAPAPPAWHREEGTSTLCRIQVWSNGRQMASSKTPVSAFPNPKKQITGQRQPDFFYLPAAAVVRMALWVVDVRRSIAAGVAVLAMAYRFWRAL
jgi:hypothetical protein